MWFRSKKTAEEEVMPRIPDYGIPGRDKPVQHGISRERYQQKKGPVAGPRRGDRSDFHFRRTDSLEQLLHHRPQETFKERQRAAPPGAFIERFPVEFRNDESFFPRTNQGKYLEQVAIPFDHTGRDRNNPGHTRIITDRQNNMVGAVHHPEKGDVRYENDNVHLRTREGYADRDYPPHHQARMHPAQLKWYKYDVPGPAQPLTMHEMWPPASPGRRPLKRGTGKHFIPPPLTRAPALRDVPDYAVIR